MIDVHAFLASFDWAFIRDNREVFWTGLQETLKVSAIAIAGAFAIGLVLGAARAHRIPVVASSRSSTSS